MSDDKDVVAAERVIPAPPEAIFDLLVHPERHKEIDGSGTVQGVKGTSERLKLGSTFGMSMKLGVPYSMSNTVIELEENRRIAWQTRGGGAIGKHVGGRIWRYELEPVDGGTKVRESRDISQESPLTKWMIQLGSGHTHRDLEATLDRIEKLVVS
jgi:uncharacterized protein YndB with AHSA1/START domain